MHGILGEATKISECLTMFYTILLPGYMGGD